MTRELLLLRHGKSDWSFDGADFDRPLKDRGKRGAQRMGVWLAQQGLAPDLVISSPAERALVTAGKVLKAMGSSSEGIGKDQRVYGAGLHALLAVLADCPLDAQRVMLVGHNPGLETLLAYLASGRLETSNDGKLLQTATLARLAMPEDWHSLAEGAGELLSITRTDSLPEKFPFPSPHGSELRNRPAYYYTQSSVIPYRISKGKPEILVISSSQKKHFVVPKGIKDPGLSPQASAAKEAWEEAGVEGNVSAEPIGTYVYAKWGATCAVEVFPMEVTRMVPDAEWQESHRGRQWVTPEQATKRLKQAELGRLVHAFVARLYDA